MCPGSCPRTPMGSAGPPCSQNRGIAVLLLIVPVLILLPTIAFASPPDPSWIAGIYDGADGDDIVMLVYETAAADAPTVTDMSLLPRITKMSLESVPQGVCGHRFTRGARAPPALRSTRPTLLFRSSPKNTPTASRTESLVNVLRAVPRSVPRPRLSRSTGSFTHHLQRKREAQLTTLRSLLVVTSRWRGHWRNSHDGQCRGDPAGRRARKGNDERRCGGSDVRTRAVR